jgi:hypothetical protein
MALRSATRERRRYMRMSCLLRVLVDGATAFDVAVTDVSPSGAGLCTALIPAVGDSLTLVDAVDPAGRRFPLGVPARVTWVRKLGPGEPATFGVSFAIATREQRHNLGVLLVELLDVDDLDES